MLYGHLFIFFRVTKKEIKMKNKFTLALLLLLFSACATYNYESDYSHNSYFQPHEPRYHASNQHEAAELIARKLARNFRHFAPSTLAILDFSDEFGERSFRGSVFADMIAFYLYQYRNPIVVKRGTLNELMLERELTIYDLLNDRGSHLRELAKADYILYGRIHEKMWDEEISLRCFESGSGRVIFAATIRNDRSDLERVFDPFRSHSPGRPQTPHPPRPYRPGRYDPDDDDNDDAEDDDLKKKPSNNDGIENVGKKDLDKSKPSDSDQYQYKGKEKDDKETVTNKGSAEKKSNSENNKIKNKPATTVKKAAKTQKSENEEEEIKAAEIEKSSIKTKK